MPERAERLLRRYYQEVWIAGRIEALDELLADDYRDHDPPPGHPPDRAGAIRFAAAFVAGLRAPRLTILTLVATADAAAAHWHLEWIQQGPLLGDPALAGRTLALRGADAITVVDGRISRIHHVERLL
jgi:predicted SnoaL-like aldol condensation-catalyzing enzyme